VKIHLSLLLLALFSSGFSNGPQREQPTETPGKLEIAKHPLILEPPLSPENRKLDATKLRADATDMANLAQSLPSDVDQIVQGKLPKELAAKLRRIEKISKHLRAELTP
jgi:hypothetical protein